MEYCIAALVHFALTEFQPAVNATSWNSPLCEVFQWGDDFSPEALAVYRVSAVCVVYVILVIHCFHPSAASYPIQQLQSKDPTQLYQGRVLLSANVKREGSPFSQCQGGKNQWLLILSAVTQQEQQLAVCFTTQTMIHRQAGSFNATECLVKGFT